MCVQNNSSMRKTVAPNRSDNNKQTSAAAAFDELINQQTEQVFQVNNWILCISQSYTLNTLFV